MAPPEPQAPLGTLLTRRRQAGAKLFVPYVTAGCHPAWLEVVAELAAAGADAVEVGLPFSDPMMDGPVIQEASRRALAEGTTTASVLGALARSDLPVPIVVMTYFNLVHRAGEERFAGHLAAAGVRGAIVPDLPLEESAPWRAAAAAQGIDAVPLVAPSTPPERAEQILAVARGFVYAVGLMGVTGERSELAASATDLARRLRGRTELPVLVGVGVSTPAQAAAIAAVADGVVVGSALVRRLLDGASPVAVGKLAREFRSALDQV